MASVMVWPNKAAGVEVRRVSTSIAVTFGRSADVFLTFEQARRLKDELANLENLIAEVDGG